MRASCIQECPVLAAGNTHHPFQLELTLEVFFSLLVLCPSSLLMDKSIYDGSVPTIIAFISHHWITELLRLEGSSSPPSTSAAPSRAGCSGPHSSGFWRSTRRRSHSLWVTCASAPSICTAQKRSWRSDGTSCAPVWRTVRCGNHIRL